MIRMHEDDQAAVAQVLAGDKNAYGGRVERHSRTIFRLAFRMTGNEQDAEEVVQETFLRGYRHLPKFAKIHPRRRQNPWCDAECHEGL